MDRGAATVYYKCIVCRQHPTKVLWNVAIHSVDRGAVTACRGAAIRPKVLYLLCCLRLLSGLIDLLSSEY